MEEERAFWEIFESTLSDPVAYLEPSARLSSVCLQGVRAVFKLCKRCGGTSISTGPLTELYTEGFDSDQVWEEVQLLNEPALRQLGRLVASMKKEGEFQLLQRTNETSVESGEEEDHLWESGGGEDVTESEDVCSGMEDGGGGGVRREGRRTAVDDRFFKLAEMERFLEKVEREEEGRGECVQSLNVFHSFTGCSKTM